MNKTLLEEMLLAGRGTLQLLLGRRDASVNFDLGMRGLLGSLIAFVVAVAFNAYLPRLLGVTDGPHPAEAMFMVLMLYAIQAGFAALVLRQYGRTDGFIPYLVCDNWATFFMTLLSAIMALIGLSGDLALFVLGIAVIVVEINIARLIVTLRPLQIAGFLGAQLIGVMIGLIIIGAIFPPAELAGQAASLSGAG